MARTPSADEQQPEKQSNHRHRPTIAPHEPFAKMRTDEPTQAHPAEIAPQKLQAGIGGEVRAAELDSKITLDTAGQIAFSYSHCQWPFVVLEG